MFDDLNKNQGGQGDAKGPKPVEDIFSGTDEAVNVEKPAAFQPKMPSREQSVGGPNGFDKRYFILGFLILCIGGIGAGGFYFYKQYVNKAGTENVVEEQQNQDQQEQGVEEDNKQDINPIMENVVADQDQDGLNDEEERVLGTDLNSIDSDNDALFDREEVKVYKTDPLNPDTDDDGHQDGIEVKNGFNPKGPGKLFEIQ